MADDAESRLVRGLTANEAPWNGALVTSTIDLWEQRRQQPKDRPIGQNLERSGQERGPGSEASWSDERSGGGSRTTTAHGVDRSHTHWDREWYSPSRRSVAARGHARRPAPARCRPVVRGTSCSTGRWPSSTTTSRCAPRPKRPSGAGRIGTAVGRPLDILRTSSSSPVRPPCATLQRGLDRAAALGRGDGVGYLPDMFGTSRRCRSCSRSSASSTR